MVEGRVENGGSCQELHEDELSCDRLDICDTISLVDLPVELLLQVFQYLEVKFISQVLAKVCTLFRELAEDPSTWRIRVRRRWPGQYPALPPDYQIHWTKACIEREEENRLWGNESENMVQTSNSTSHYASVDAVHVMDNIVASGSRDHSIVLWSTGADSDGYVDSEAGGSNMSPVDKHPGAHAGWVWTFASRDDLLVSGAWDSCVKFWQVESSGAREARCKAQLKTAVLSLDICENRIVAGTFDNKVVQLDTREDVKKMSFYKSHSRPVLKVKITPTKIYSISEDGNLAVHDRVAAKLFKKVKLPGSTDDLQRSYPLSMDSVGNCLYVGDSAGRLNFVDTTADTSFQFVQSYKTGHAGRVTGVQCNLGAVITSSTDGTIKIFQPSRNLEPMSSIQLGEGNVVTGISYRNQVLAAATCNNTVHIWKSKLGHL